MLFEAIFRFVFVYFFSSGAPFGSDTRPGWGDPRSQILQHADIDDNHIDNDNKTQTTSKRMTTMCDVAVAVVVVSGSFRRAIAAASGNITICATWTALCTFLSQRAGGIESQQWTIYTIVGNSGSDPQNPLTTTNRVNV